MGADGKILVLNLLCAEKKKRKAMPYTVRGSPLGCETSRLLYFIDNLLTDSFEQPFNPRENFWHSILLEAESTPGL
jgi:hypothetical protein